jgi:nucleoid-associated protein YgaU
VALVTGLVVGLALPVSALGGRPVGSPSPLRAPTAGHGFVYTVRPGDTLWSIATRMEPGGDPRRLVAQLADRLGTDTVFAGERLRLP